MNGSMFISPKTKAHYQGNCLREFVNMFPIHSIRSLMLDSEGNGMKIFIQKKNFSNVEFNLVVLSNIERFRMRRQEWEAWVSQEMLLAF